MPPSDLALDLDDLDSRTPTDAPAKESDCRADCAPASGLDLDLADEDEDALASPPSDFSLDDVDEPTVAALDDDEPADALVARR